LYAILPLQQAWRQNLFFGKKDIAFFRAQGRNSPGRKLLDPLPLGRYIGSSRPSKVVL
jgi:hypothetical protein